MLKFLNLPKDRQGVEERYREAIESKNLKPKNLLVKELKETLTWFMMFFLINYILYDKFLKQEKFR